MKAHILFTIITALFLTACASHKGRSIATSAEVEEQEEFTMNRAEGSGARDIGREVK